MRNLVWKIIVFLMAVSVMGVFVRYDCEKDGDGEISEYDYGMISKEDFLNNIPNYKQVNMIYSGVVY